MSSFDPIGPLRRRRNTGTGVVDAVVDKDNNTVFDASLVPAEDGAIGALWSTVQGGLSVAGAYTQLGTGALRRTGQAKNRDTIVVEEFLDSGTAWQTDLGPSLLRAITAANARGKTLRLNADLFGSYPVSSAVNFRGDIDIEGEKETEINGTGFSGLNFLQLGGSISPTEIPLTSNPSAGFHEIDITSSASFAPGDVVLLTTARAAPTLPAVALTLSATTPGAIVNVTAASSVFTADMVGRAIIVPGQEVSMWIQSYSSGTAVTAFISLERQPSSTTIASGTWYINDLFNPQRYYYFKGEFKTVASVPSGAALRFTEPLDDSYLAAYTVVKKVSPARVNLSGFSIRRNTNVGIGLDLSYLRNSSMEQIGGRGARVSLHRARYIYGFTAKECYGDDFWYSGSGTSYGLLIGTGQDIVEIGCQYSGGIHAISHGDLEPTRRIKVQGCILAQHHTGVTSPALDFHGSCEDVTLLGNTAAGLGISCKNVQSNGNTWKTNGKCEGVVLYCEIPSDYFRFNDYIETTTVAKEAFHVTPAAPNITIGEIVVAGNVKSALSSAFAARPRAVGVTGVTVNRLELSGNFSAPSNASIDTTIGGTSGIRWNRTILNGRYSNSAVNANVVLDAAAGSGDVWLTGEIDGPNGLGSPFYVESGSGYRNVTFNGAQIRTTGGDRCYIGNSGIFTMTGGTVFTGQAALEIGTMASGPTDVIINDSHRDGGQRIRTSTANARTYTFRGQHGSRIGFATAAPTTLTWFDGDTFHNWLPVVGQPRGWICTAGGTPGTWTSLGNL